MLGCFGSHRDGRRIFLCMPGSVTAAIATSEMNGYDEISESRVRM
jgi:hypothetical protein